MLNRLALMILDEEGQGLVEYALIIALVSILAIAALKLIGTTSNSSLNSAASALNAG